MRLKFVKLWESLRSSYWFVPSLMTLSAVGLAFGLVRFDRTHQEGLVKQLGWIYTGGPEGARAVLSVIAGSVMGTAGVTFSITIAALSLASGQFGPRLLRNFMRDTGNQVVLGTFLATFLYCLLVLRTVRGGEDGARFVPHFSTTVGVALALASLGVLIFFIHHIAVSIQAPQVVAGVASELHDQIRRLFPRNLGREVPPARLRSVDRMIPPTLEQEGRRIVAPESGYVQAIAQETLLKLATEHDLLVRLEYRPGDFVVKDDDLAIAWPPQHADDEVAELIREVFLIGPQRTQVQDVEFSINQLVEIAVRALSPGINDPFTAINCVDALRAGLCHLAPQEFPSPYRFDRHERLRVISGPVFTFGAMVDSAFDQIRQYGRDSAPVTIRLLEALATVMRCTNETEYQAALLRQAEMIRRGAMEALPEPQDRQVVEERYAAVLRASRTSENREARGRGAGAA